MSLSLREALSNLLDTGWTPAQIRETLASLEAEQHYGMDMAEGQEHSAVVKLVNGQVTDARFDDDAALWGQVPLYTPGEWD